MTVAALDAIDDDTVVIVVSHDEWQQHMRQVRVCVTLLHAFMAALGTNPMFSAFLPMELQNEIRAAAGQ